MGANECPVRLVAHAHACSHARMLILFLGDVVNVLGTFIPLPSTSASCALTSSITISSKENYLILHPDVLITATALANSAQCRRKPVLSSMVRSASDTNPSMLWGTILHEVTQLCLRERRWDEPWISAQIDKSIQENLINLVKNNVSIEQAQREVKMRSRGLQTFFTRYMADEPKVANRSLVYIFYLMIVRQTQY